MEKGEQKIKLLVLWDILKMNTDEDHAMNADRNTHGTCRTWYQCDSPGCCERYSDIKSIWI